MKLLVCNAAWMRNYEGLRGDPPLHGGSFISRHGYGGEILKTAAVLGLRVSERALFSPDERGMLGALFLPDPGDSS